ncbi:MAG: hypothetical protein SXG53_28820 [Pseudomonadota bacterium]|nr:hypothetical protein [Pseudomonadota bacterium]
MNELIRFLLTALQRFTPTPADLSRTWGEAKRRKRESAVFGVGFLILALYVEFVINMAVLRKKSTMTSEIAGGRNCGMIMTC